MDEQYEEVLELIARGAPLNEALTAIARLIEARVPGAIASVLLVAGDRLFYGVAPGLPDAFNRAVDGLAIAEGSGICGTAAHRRAPVIVPDIGQASFLAPYHDLAATHGLRASWSIPVITHAGEVIATFAIYHRDVFQPTEAAARWVETGARLVRVAVEQDRLRLEKRRMADHLAEVIERVGEALIFLDSAWRVKYMNAEAERLLRRTRDTLAGKVIWEEFPDAVGMIFETAVKGAVLDMKPAHFEEEYAPLQGFFEVHAYPSGDGVAVFFRDVTKRRTEAARLAERAALFDGVRDAIAVRTVDDTIQFWSPSAAALYGWTAAEAVGKSARDLLNRGSAEYDLAKKRLLARDEWVGTLTHFTKSGAEIPVTCRWTLVRDDAGNPRSVLAVLSDASKQRLTAATVQRTLRLESVATMTGSLAQDLSNVIAPLALSLDLINELVGPEGSELVAALEGNVKRGAELVRRALGYAKAADAAPVATDLCEIVRDVEDVIRAEFPRSVEIHGVAAGLTAPVVVDTAQLRHVALHLCQNARVAMRDRGRLTLRVGREHLTDRAAALDVPPGEYVTFTVADTGIGIAEELQERIFEPFFTTGESAGGLGLSTVRSVLRAHGGAVTVESELGLGAAFTCYIPAPSSAVVTSLPPRAADVDRPTAEAAAREIQTILLVDDEEMIRKVAKRILERHGYTVILAGNGQEALALYDADPGAVDVAICDLSMPILDGPGTVKALRERRADLPVIISTGYLPEQGDAKLQGIVVNQFLSKPFTAEVLLQAVEGASSR